MLHRRFCVLLTKSFQALISILLISAISWLLQSHLKSIYNTCLSFLSVCLGIVSSLIRATVCSVKMTFRLLFLPSFFTQVPFHDLLQDNVKGRVPIQWNTKADEAFEACKAALNTATLLNLMLFWL